MVARDCWLDIPDHHPHVELDAFVIMPNHTHGILLFVGDAPAQSSVEATPASRPSHATGPTRGSLGAVIGSYKSAVTRTINRLRPGAGSDLWQLNYYEHIIRNDHARDRIQDYIDSNPDRWVHDLENPNGDGTDDVVAFMRMLAEDSPLRGDRDAGVAPTRDRDAGVAPTEETT
jgi:REP element-mobilizing transposase RayT